MKSTAKTHRKITTLLCTTVSFVLTFALFSSCTKDDDMKAEGTAEVMVVNAAEGSGSQDLYLDNSKITADAVAYSEHSSYISTKSGSRKADFKASGSTEVTSSAQADLKPGKHYTIILKGGASSKETIVTEDNLDNPPAGKAKVRCIHLSPLAPSVDIAVKNGASLFSSLGYGSVSQFTTVDAGVQNLHISLTGNTALGIDVPVTFEAGRIYTIWASGTSALDAQIITNK